MKTRVFAFVLSLVLVLGGNTVRSAAITWTNTAGGDWSVAANWSPNQAPGSSDSAFINGGGAYTITINNLTVGNVTLGDGSGQQTLDWNNSTLAAGSALTVASNATLELLGGSSHLDGMVTNAGTVTWTSPAYYLYLGAAFYNLPGAIFNAQDSGWPMNNDGGGVFNNAGVVNVAVGAGNSTTCNVPFNNNGTLAVQSGTLNFNSSSSGSSGLFTVAAGTTLVFNSPYTLSSDGEITGAGTVQINQDFMLDGSLNASLSIGGGTFTNDGSLSCTNLAVYNATLAGASNWVVYGTWNWNNSTLAAGSALTVASNATLELLGGSSHLDGMVTNAGTVTWTSPAYYLYLGAAFYNLPGAIFNAQDSGWPMNNDGGGVFNNAGAVNVAVGAGNSTTFNVPFNNDGTLAVQSGTLNLNSSSSGSGGLFTVATGTTLVFNNPYTLSSGGEISGAGNVQVNNDFLLNGDFNATLSIGGGTFTNNGSLSCTNLAVYNVTLAGGSNWVVYGTWNWNNVTLAAGTALMVPSNAVLELAGGSSHLDGMVTNAGTVTWTSPAYYLYLGAPFYNLPGAIFNAQDSGWPMNNDGGGVFNNAGVVNVAVGAGNSTTFNVPFNNDGTLAVQSGTLNFNSSSSGSSGLFTVAAGTTLVFNNPYTLSSGGEISGAGIVQVNNNFLLNGNVNATLSIGGGTFTNNGSVSCTNLAVNNVTLAGASNWVVYGTWNWNGGTLAAGSALTVPSNAALVLSGGSSHLDGLVTNMGTVTWTSPAYYLYLGAAFYNLPGAIFNAQDSGWPMNNDGGGVFNNAGVVNVAVGAGNSTTFNVPFNNNGTLAVQSGTLNFNSSSSGSSGLFTVAAGTTLVFNNPYALSSGGEISGAGNVQVNNNFLLNGSVNATLTIGGGTFTNNGSLSCTNLAVYNVTLAGASNWVVYGAWNWNGGTLAAGSALTVPSNAALLLSGGSSHLDGLVTNAGTVTWTSPAYYLYLGAPFYNLPGAIFNAQDSGWPMNNDGGGIFNNAGVVNVAVGAGNSTTFNVPFNNNGTLELETGTLNLNSSYDLTNGVLNFGLNGAANFGQVSLAGNPASLAGTISATFNSNYFPLVGAAFDVIHFSSSAGGFSNTNLPSIAVWQTAYNPANVTITLLKWVPQLTWTNPADIVYGNPLNGTQLNASAVSPTNPGVSLAGSFAYTPPLGAALLAGNGQTLSVTFTPADLATYTNVGANVTIDVLPAPLTVTASALSKTYGQTETFAGTDFTTVGLKYSDSVTSVSLTSPGAVATAPVAGSPYPIIPSAAVGSGLANYTISYVDGNLAVKPAPLAVSANPASRNYGAANPAFSAALSGFVNGETASVVSGAPVLSTLATVTSAVGTYSITPSLGTLTAANYTFGPFVSALLTVNPAPLTITANSRSKTYGQTVTFAGTEFAAAGLVNGDTITSVTLSSSGAAASAGVAGSPYAITPSAAVGSGVGNYAITYVPGTLTVSPATLTVTANNRSKTYGQTVTFAGTEFAAAGLVNGDTITSVTLSSSGAAASAGVAGSPYAITPSAAVGSGVGNYAITYVPGTLTVSPATLTVTANNRSKTYGQTVTFAGTEFAAAGLLNSDTITSVTLSSSGAAANAGVAGSPYAITPSAAVGSGVGNYAITYAPGTLTVIPAPLTITADNRTKTFGQTVTFAGTEFTASGLLNSDTVASVTLTSAGAAASATVAGSPYSIVPSAALGSGLGNYAIAYVDGLLTVIASPLPPYLSFVFSRPNLTLLWPTNVGHFGLIQAASLAPSTTWIPVTNGITVSGTNNTATINASGGGQYYKLVSQ